MHQCCVEGACLLIVYGGQTVRYRLVLCRGEVKCHIIGNAAITKFDTLRFRDFLMSKASYSSFVLQK